MDASNPTALIGDQNDCIFLKNSLNSTITVSVSIQVLYQDFDLLSNNMVLYFDNKSKSWSGVEESNLYSGFRRPLHYPLY